MMDFNEFAPLFGSWADRFKPFIESQEMFNIYQRLKADSQKEKVVPSSENVFRAFQTSSPNNLRVIIYAMDPYAKRYKNKAYQATGIALDNSNSPDGELQPSLELFYKGIENDLDIKVDRSISLQYLQDQGVMFLNTDLTCKLNKTGSHKKLWEPFQKFFLEEIMFGITGIIYILAGDESKRMERYINPLGNYIFKVEHPVAASYSNREWNHQNIFKKINKILKENNNFSIEWDNKKYQELLKPPF